MRTENGGTFMTCKICQREMSLFATATILGRHDVKYYRCSECEFVCTEEPYWLEEAYAQPVSRSDVGLVSRNLLYARVTKVLLFSFFDRGGRFLDYGGGYGLFARIMRDSGFDFYWYDAHCANLFAEGFEASMDADGYELVTAFEVVEHPPDPLREIREVIGCAGSVLFSTRPIPAGPPLPGSWWYYGLDHGQHVAFYSRKTLNVIADLLGLSFHTNGRSLHLLTRRQINPLAYRCLSRYKVALPLSLLLHKRSLQGGDYSWIAGGH